MSQQQTSGSSALVGVERSFLDGGGAAGDTAAAPVRPEPVASGLGPDTAVEDLVLHGPGALPHGYVPNACGDDCDNSTCPAGLDHARCAPECVGAPTPTDVPTGERYARDRADVIRTGMRSYVTTLGIIRQAYQARDWEVLGYDTWESYVQAEFGADRLRLSPADRRRAVEAMRLDGMSTRAIGAAIGVSEATVRRDLDAASDDAPAPDRVIGTDGKAYPARRTSADTDEMADDPEAAPSLSPLCRDGNHQSCDGTIHIPRGIMPPHIIGCECECHQDSPAPDEWAPEPAGGGAVTSATPGNPTAEAPGDPDPDEEYRPWRQAAALEVSTAREALRVMTGDWLDSDVVAERADDGILADLDQLRADLARFLEDVWAIRSPMVWIAVQRHGVQYHQPAGDGTTACGRSTRTGVVLTARQARLRHEAVPCKRCWPEPTDEGQETKTEEHE